MLQDYLYNACRKHDIEKIKYYIEKGAQPDCKCIHVLIKKHKALGTLRLLCQSCPPAYIYKIILSQYDEYHVIRTAVASDSIAILQFLMHTIVKGRGVNWVRRGSQRLDRPLEMACRKRNYDMMKCLLEGGAEVNDDLIEHFMGRTTDTHIVDFGRLRRRVRRYYRHIVLLLIHGLNLFRYQYFIRIYRVFPQHLIKLWVWHQPMHEVITQYTRNRWLVYNYEFIKCFSHYLKPFIRIIEKSQNRYIKHRLSSVHVCEKNPVTDTT